MGLGVLVVPPATGDAMLHDPKTLNATNVIVIAPHPDDESLGCGGLISVLAAAGRSFHTIFVTDGGASHLHSRSWPRNRVAALREMEAAEALVHLGIGAHPRTFLRLRDAEMPRLSRAEWRSTLLRLTEIFRSFRPDLVLIPWRRDPHCDHRESWRLAKAAMARTGNNPMTFEYAIWLDELGFPSDYPRPQEAERVDFDIRIAVPGKLAAISAHRSQTTNLIDDDATAFRLSTTTIDRLSTGRETYWRPLS
jgi:LmbE family N-acetylglucosaminyl deacetylase